MNRYTFIATRPGAKDYPIFDNFPKEIYEKNSPRFVLGHQPTTRFLKQCMVMMEGDKAVGRFAFYINPSLSYHGKTACVGSYECIEEASASECLLDKAKEMAQNVGARWLIGPMEGSTWESYRWSLHNDQPNFFMEPYHHTYYNQQFVASGFSIIAYYYSNLDEVMAYDVDKIQAMEDEYRSKGAVIRPLNMGRLRVDLTNIAQLSIEGFAHNFLYSPLTELEFVEKYIALKSFFDPDFIWLIEDARGLLQAFIFAVKDHLDPAGQTVIIKSLVRKKESPFQGVGRYLSAKINQIASERGFTKVIHALMIADNASRKISGAMSVAVYKEYGLYGVEL